MSRMRFARSPAALAASAVLAAAAAAEAPLAHLDTDGVEARIAEQVEQIASRLALDDAQRGAAAPVLDASFRHRAALVEEARADGAVDRREALALRDGFRNSRDAMLRDLSGILTPAQLEELQAILAEQRQELRARLSFVEGEAR